MGRFTTVDPLGASARVVNPQTFNRYTYVLNNPLRYVDPDGMKEKDAWDQLSEAEQKAIASKLKLGKGQTVRQRFNELVTVKGDATKTAANILSVQNFIAQAGGLKNSDVWQQITEIASVTAKGPPSGEKNIGGKTKEILDGSDPNKHQQSDMAIRVADKDKFLTALKNDPINQFLVNSTGDEIWKGIGASWHQFDNARATTDYKTDPQMHYFNDHTDKPAFGPKYFELHWDPTSSNGRKSTIIGDLRGGAGHDKRRATVGEVKEYLKRTNQAPK